MEFKNKTILLVEDELMIAIQEKRWLEKEGYKVKHVTAGEEAIKVVNEIPDQIDLILMDINLGAGVKGTEAAIRIQSCHDIPLLFLSSHTEKDIVSLTEEITSYGYIVKGSGETVLLACIKMAFRLHHSKKEVLLQEEKFHRISEKLDVTLNSIGDGVIATDIYGKVTLINPVAAYLCGFNEEEALGKPLSDVFIIINSKTRKKVENPVKTVLETGRRVGLANHTVLISRDGREYQIFDSAAPILDYQKNILGVVLVFSDVTEKYHKEELLRESEERLRFALEGTNDGIWDVNMKTGEVFISPRGCEILGYGRNELPDFVKVWNEMVFEEDLPLTYKRLEQYLRKESEIFEVEQRLKTKSGECKWILTRGKAVSFDSDGTPLRMTGTHTDISKRKMAEEALFESEEHFKALFDNAPLGYQSLDENGNFIEVNQKWLEILGYDKEEVIGKWFGDFLAPEMVDAFRARFPMFKARGKVHTEFDLKKKDGSLVSVVFDGRIGHTPDGNFKQTHCILQDVTDRKSAEAEKIRYTQELIASNKIKDRTLSIIAHDLKGPFSGFLGLSRELADNAENMSKKEISEIASTMHLAAEGSFELLLNLLEWSRLQAHKMDINPDNLNLFTETEEVISLFKSVLNNKSITIINNVAKEIAIFSDKNALSTVLRNLIDNAIKFSNAGTSVRIEANVKEGVTEISVIDSGTGIRDEDIDKIIGSDLFISARGTMGEKGSGLGLKLCKDILKLIGSELKIESRLNEGTKISFTL